MQSGSVTLAIPLIEKHDRLLPRLFRNLQLERDRIAAVLVMRSGLDPGAHSDFDQFIRDLGRRAFPQSFIRLISSAKHLNAALNRNQAWQFLDTEFVAFVDADDLYVPGRLARLQEIAFQTQADAVAHSYLSDLPARAVTTRRLAPSTPEIIPSDAIRRATLTMEGAPGVHPTNVIAPRADGTRVPVHHGHLFVRSALGSTIRFPDRPTGEDGMFCREILRRDGNFVVVDEALSIYNPRESQVRSLVASVRRRITAFH